MSRHSGKKQGRHARSGKKQGKKRGSRRQITSTPPEIIDAIFEPIPYQKMAECIDELLEPFHDEVTSVASFRKLLATTTLAWNATILPPEVHQPLFEQAHEETPPDERDAFIALYCTIFHRKQQMFPHDQRLIAMLEPVRTDEGYIVAATSILPNPQQRPFTFAPGNEAVRPSFKAPPE